MVAYQAFNTPTRFAYSICSARQKLQYVHTPTRAPPPRSAATPRETRALWAQICDLLDAAAALGGVPLLALVRVRMSLDGQVNPKAFHEEPELRHKILRTVPRGTLSRSRIS